MLNFKPIMTAFVFAGIVTATFMNPVSAAAPTGMASDYGVSVPADSAMRTIVINADTKWVNVANGETVRFNVGDQSFTWHFDTFRNETAFDLAKIAPSSAQVGAVRAYVAANPLYRG